MSEAELGANDQEPHGSKEDERPPLLIMWYQTRDALADFTIPVLAGLKVVWLIAFSPTKFFMTDLDRAKNLARLRTPFDVFWRALTRDERTPLDAAKFLLFGILTAAFAGFGFDNTNRLTGMIAQGGILGGGLGGFKERIPGLAAAAGRLRALAADETVQAIQAFFDRDLISAIIELIVTLLITMLFAALFRLVAGRKISATNSYSFWLYMTGMQFFTTAITFVFFKIFSLPALGLPQLTPEIFFLVVEYGWLILWMFVIPLLVLPRIYEGLTRRNTLIALLVTHGVFWAVGWLFRAGFTTILLFWGSLIERL